MLFFHKKNRNKETDEQKAASPDNGLPKEYLNDITYIQDLKQTMAGAWYQYDILLAAGGYGWEYMLSSADYLAGADLEGISEVRTGSIGQEKMNVTDSFTKNGSKCTATPELKTENGMLSIAGISKALHAPVKIVWINQTRVLRLFTVFNDETMIKRYVETVIRRTFGTKDAMKLGKPLPEKKAP